VEVEILDESENALTTEEYHGPFDEPETKKSGCEKAHLHNLGLLSLLVVREADEKNISYPALENLRRYLKEYGPPLLVTYNVGSWPPEEPPTWYEQWRKV